MFVDKVTSLSLGRVSMAMSLFEVVWFLFVVGRTMCGLYRLSITSSPHILHWHICGFGLL